jgi:hypothetical protein
VTTLSASAALQFDGLAYAPSHDGLSDANIAAGPHHLVQMVNSQYAVFDKSGHLLQGYPKSLHSIWDSMGAPCNTDGGDPIVLYDRIADRWWLSQIAAAGSPYQECVAVSTSGDPTGAYSLYAYDFGNNVNDWPKFGVWPTATDSAYLGSYDLYANAQTLVGTALCGYDRDAMIAGHANAAQVCFTVPNSAAAFSSALPVDLDGATRPPNGAPAYFLNVHPDELRLYELHLSFTQPAASTLSGPTSVAVAPFSQACPQGGCVAQADTSNVLAPRGDRLMYRLAYRNFGNHEVIVANHSIATASGIGIRWYELRSPGDALTLYQQGTIASNDTFRWLGSIATDKAGDIAVAYNISSATIHPGIAFSGRIPTDPIGTMESEVSLLVGGGSQTAPGKWSDTSALRVDPTDDCTFWYTTQYLKSDGSGNWVTRIASFVFSNCVNGTATSGATGNSGTNGCSFTPDNRTHPDGVEWLGIALTALVIVTAWRAYADRSE